MGQGFSLATPPAGAVGIDVPELSDLVYEKTVGSARFMKSIRARHHDGVALVKVLIKPHSMSLDKYKMAIIREHKALSDVPNAIGYQRVIETETTGYLVRQFLYNSLYDRLITRPFLEDIEKRWLAFQLLCALRDCHSRDIYHGDIKTENTLVTSWNWLYLSDFSSSYKRVMLPETNPADFSYFFDTSGRRTCYIAPERFYKEDQEADPDAKITWAMDVFSAGCVIAELFLEAPIFSLSQLYMYKDGKYDPKILHLSRIHDRDLREMVAHMMQIDPEKRYTAEQYLDFFKDRVFPAYFYSFLHQYMEVITDISHCQHLDTGMFRHVGEADQRIDRVYNDFDKISYFLGYQNHDRPPDSQPSPRMALRLGLDHFPVRLSISDHEHYIQGGKQPTTDDGTLIFLTLVVSSLRNTTFASSRIRACDVLLAFSERLTDEAKLDRVLPYLMSMLTDEFDMVVVTAIRTITQLLKLVRVVTPVNSYAFMEYILPRMQVCLLSSHRMPSPIVRATYASCLGSLATTAGRFLEISTTLKVAAGSLGAADPDVELGTGAEANNAAFGGLFDDAHGALVELFEAHTKMLIEDADPFVRRAFLTSVPELCIFFGTADANDIVLTHLNTYLNDSDWMLKCAFFDTMVAIAAFLGSSSLEKFILPLMVQAVTDPEEFVVQSALHALAELANLGLLSRPTICELVSGSARFTMHPNMWIRESAAELLSAGTRFLSPADVRCMVLPLVRSFLKPDMIPDFSELGLLDALKKPLTRTIFDQALTWAQKTDRSDFWKPLKQKSGGAPLGSTLPGSRGAREANPQALSNRVKNEEDEQWLNRLRSLGLTSEDEPNLVALREFIWSLSLIKSRHQGAQESLGMVNLEEIIALRSLGITPKTVMFEEESSRRPSCNVTSRDVGAPRTITDALLDASMTIDDPVGKRKRAALNAHRSRLNSPGTLSPMADGRVRLEEELISPTTVSATRCKGTVKASSLSPLFERSSGSAEAQKSFNRSSLRHQSSAISLMNRKDSAKSIAETGTTETNAFGEMEGPFSQGPQMTPSPRESIPGDDVSESVSEQGHSGARWRPSHTYDGNDPSVLSMLNAMYVDNFPHDIAEFGPLVTPVSRRKSGEEGGWRPAGIMVATFAEHTGPIRRVVVAPDHLFFLTGGDDGVVRVWDSARLERSITHRSRQVHKHGPGSKVTALCFIENTHSFVSCASDGSVHVVKVDTSSSGASVRYGKLRLLREYQQPDGEHAVWCEHYKHDNNSVLILATNQSRLVGLDLRTMALLFVLENPVHHGTPTCFCVDRKRSWLCLGTSHGVLDLWDLRFRTRLKAWGVPGKGVIHRLCLHPAKGRGKWVCVAGGTGHGEVTAWDLDKATCREVYRIGSGSYKDSDLKAYEAWEVDEDKPEGMLGRFATDIEQSVSASADRGVCAMVTGTASPEDQRDVRYPFIITAGSDKKLRFWDLARIENSSVFCGTPPEDGRLAYSVSHPTPSMTVHVERTVRPPAPATPANGTGGAGATATSKGGSGSARSTRPTRTSVISLSQQQLLRSHVDSITDVALLEHPCTMSLSVDRSGVVFVYQ